ncbi:MAG: glycosyltransferase family 2 protein [Cytophagales bacterium]|nr:glycosyltransferase family 2 protein [Cytophagales bacterium]
MNFQLSAVIITFNEERNIKRCLESVKDIADEIVVVDSFSKDQTKEICEKYSQLTFMENPFEGHIQQKNFAITQATKEYVLSLDADEELSKEAVKDILKIKQEGAKADAYSFHRLNNFCGTWIKHSGWYPDTKIRLFRKGVGQWTGQNPHDRYEIPSQNSCIALKSDILHYTVADLQEHIKQINYFTEIAAQELYKKGKKSSILKILLSPIIKFIRDYFIKLGFLDGFAGLLIARNSAHAKFLKYSKLYLMNKNKK